MPTNSNSPFTTSEPSTSRQASGAPSANDVFRANQSANQRHVGPVTTAPAIPGYRPSGRIGPFGLPLLFLSLCVVPIVCAWLYETLGHFFDFVMISAMLLGVLAGAALNRVVHWGKVRNVPIAAVVGILVGLLTFAFARGFEAWSYRPQYVQEYSSYLVKAKGLTPQQAQSYAEKFLTPLTMTQIYWLDVAESGMTLKSSEHDRGSQVSGIGFWALQACEGLALVAFCALMAGTAASRRFSEEFNRWYVTKTLYNVYPQYATPLIDAAQSGDWVQCHAAAQHSLADRQRALLQVDCAYLPEKPGGILTVKAVTNTKKGLQTVFERELSNDEMKTMWPAFPMPNTTPQPFST